MRPRAIGPFWISIVLAFVVASAASMLPSFTLYLFGQLGVMAMVTVATIVLIGAAGILSLASAAFMALGGFSALILMQSFGIPVLLAVPLAVIMCTAVGIVMGLVALRISGFHLAIVTLGFLQVVQVFLKRGGEMTGSGYGLIAAPVALPFGLTLNASTTAILAVGLAIVTIGVCVAALNSRIGRTWIALRDNESAAQMVGANISRLKVLAFAFASTIIAAAGVLHVFLVGVASPTAYGIDLSIFHITLAIVGGLSRLLTGAIISPAILFLLPEMFTALGEWRDVFYGVILLLTLVFLPSGIGVSVEGFVRRLLGFRAAQ